ncbi:serine/threonine protein phosphatase [Pedobacter frigoris]|uniref:Serine/threonine protein phosphatase n=2 Tax=Pedobacter frigoris TaxID=2571272 RepID=A0A4U1CQW8_9SPHI|nr:serine/threonine protein phosphatase [Pedobacter frigoris]
MPTLLFSQHTAGRVFFGNVSAGGRGIPGVAVSDGLKVTHTDKRGGYRLVSLEAPDFIFISLPSGYRAPVSEGIPHYFERVNDQSAKKKRIDFELERNQENQERYQLIVCADPQVGFDEDVPKLESLLADMKKHVREEFSGMPVYGIMCGDIIEGMNQASPTLQAIKQRFSETEIPFFYVAGNHDMDLGARSNLLAKQSYKKIFGPSYYSFNLGKVHYVVLDDVFSTGKSYGYIGYLEERQLQWLEQDLASIPQGSTVIVSVHIPSYSVSARKGDFGAEDIKKVIQNRQALYKILMPYQAHIFSGHEHYQENYVLKDNLFEHVHGALCGIFWQAPYNSDGTPLGYTVYEVDGEKLSWYFKAAGKDKNIQCAAYLPGADTQNPEALVVNVWNYDSAWKVYWYEDGKKMGEMKQSKGWDPDIVQYVKKNQQNFRYKYIGAGPSEHMFYAVPLNKHAQFKIEVVDRFNNVYTTIPQNVNKKQISFR